jgi:membrane protease YdiL (CAAX protease family)
VEAFVSPATPRSYLGLPQLTAGVIGYMAAMAGTEIVAVAVGPLQGATCLALMFITLVNLTILARLREADSAGYVWRLLAVASIPPLERLLLLCMPPLHWGRLQEYVFWSVPLVVGVIVLFRTPLLAHVADARPRLIRTRHAGYGLPGLSGQLLVAFAGAALGVAAGLRAEGHLLPIGELLRAAQPAWLGIVMVVFASCGQELLYRGVIQPAATAVGDWVGVVVCSLLMASAWLAWVGVAVALPVIAASLLFGWAVRRWHALIGVLVGHGLFNLALALLWHRMLL